MFAHADRSSMSDDSHRRRQSTPPHGDRAAVDMRASLGVVLSLLGRGTLAYHPRLVGISGGVTPALMLSQALYWTRILAQQGDDRDGWFWKTREEWRAETALSRHEQESARKRLARHSFWQQRRRGMPARMWFRVDLDALAYAIDAAYCGRWDWQDQTRLLNLLGRPLVVYRSLADACGSVTAAILLSRLLHELRASERRSHLAAARSAPMWSQAWHALSPREMMAATGLTKAEFYHARSTLRQAAYVHDRLEGVPPRALWRLDADRIAASLRTLIEVTEGTEITPQTRVVDQLAGIRTKECGYQPTKIPESGQLEFSIPANLMAGFRTPSWPESGISYMGLTTVNQSTSTTPPPTPSGDPGPFDAANAEGVVGFDDALIWPKTGILPGERSLATALLSPVADQAQTLVDELAGQMAKGIIREPLAYLRKLVEQARQGQFIPLVATRVAAQRDRLAALESRRQSAAQPRIESLSELSAAQREARRLSLRPYGQGPAAGRRFVSTTSQHDEMNS